MAGPQRLRASRSPQDVVIAPDGAVYIADTGNHVVLGAFGLMAPPPLRESSRPSADSRSGGMTETAGPLQARASITRSRCYGPDGGLYISNGSMIRKVGPDGVIRTIAGTGTGGFLPLPADDVQALQADLSAVDFAFDRQGNLYFADNRFSRVRRLDRAGRVTTVAGCVGTPCRTFGRTGDPAPTQQSAGQRSPRPHAVRWNPQRPDGSRRRRRRHHPKGCRRGLRFGFGVPATSVQLFVIGLAMGQNGRMYVAGTNTGLHVIESPLPSLSASYVIPSQEASEVYSFDSDGRHLHTLDARTGAARTTFAYGATGFVSSLTDGDGNVTTIQRDASGTPTWSRRSVRASDLVRRELQRVLVGRDQSCR